MQAQVSQALVPFLLQRREKSGHSVFMQETLSILIGLALLSLLAQVAIPLPWTPVPITGQTLGVALLGLSWGGRRAGLIFLAYLLLGSLGLPIFAMGKSGFLFGPTFGYLVGMAAASFIVGQLADRGLTRSFWGALLASYIGSAVIFGLGLFGLSFFVPGQDLLMAGLLPFLPGDLIKNLISASVSWQLRRQSESQGSKLRS